MLPQIMSKQNALERALAGIDAQMCVRFTRRGEGENEIISTSFSKKDMNYFVCLELAEEIALSMRIKRIAPGMKDPHEENDLLQLDPDAKICVTYDPETQDYHYMRRNMTPMDAALACEAVAATCRAILYAPALLTAWWIPDDLSETMQQVARGDRRYGELSHELRCDIIQAILGKMGFPAWISPAVEVDESDGATE